MPVRVNGCLKEELKYPTLVRSMVAKRRNKIFRKPSEALLHNSGLYILTLWRSGYHYFTTSFIKPNSGSAQVQILHKACRRFAMVRIFDNGPS